VQVREAAESLQEGVIAQACGSFRRGKATCGDVDVLVTHPDGRSHRGLFARLLAKLKQQGGSDEEGSEIESCFLETMNNLSPVSNSFFNVHVIGRTHIMIILY